MKFSLGLYAIMDVNFSRVGEGRTAQPPLQDSFVITPDNIVFYFEEKGLTENIRMEPLVLIPVRDGHGKVRDRLLEHSRKIYTLNISTSKN